MSASWYRYSDGERPLYRLPVTVDNTSGSAAATDIVIQLGSTYPDLDLIWTASQSNGYDIRVTGPDGRTIVGTFDIQTWNQTNRTGTIRIDGYQAPVAGTFLLWLYWGKPAGDATSVWGTPTMSSAKTGYLFRGDPLTVPASQRIEGRPTGDTRATTPRAELRKGTSEQVRVYALVGGIRRSTLTASQSADGLDVPSYATHDVVDANGTDASTMYSAATGRFATDDRGRLWFSWIVKAGTNDTSYTTRCLATFNEESGASGHEIRRYVLGVRIREPLAA